MLSYMEAAKAHGAIYRLVIAGFAVAIVGIVVGEHAATVGNGVTGTGIALIAVGTVMTMLRGRRKE